METRTAARGLNYLASLTGYESTGAIQARSPAHTKTLLRMLGNPERAYPAIHVTGTNGKGSTSAMIAGLLDSAGLRVGLYTSPHLLVTGERIRVGGVAATEVELDQLLNRVQGAAARADITPTWFEALTVAGLLQFAQADVDVAVVEVGMLGRWDATNVLDAATVVITNVDLDHTEFAGNSRSAIASEKAGIVGPHATVLLGQNDPELRAIVAAQRPTRTLVLGRDFAVSRRSATPSGQSLDVRLGRRLLHFQLALTGVHQSHNAALALAAAEAHLDAALSSDTVANAMRRMRVTGRFDRIAGGRIIVDVAHNPAGAAALRAALDETFGTSLRRVFVVGTLRDRDVVADFLRNLGAAQADIVVTEPPSPRRLPAADIASAAMSLGSSVVIEPDPRQALQRATELADTESLVIVTGSHQLVATALSALADTHDVSMYEPGDDQ